MAIAQAQLTVDKCCVGGESTSSFSGKMFLLISADITQDTLIQLNR